ncbi:MAG: tetratricopeptide repeat protein [Marinilabiliales bacterium]|nr:tetratricopeptide repeat protein [Marinilabiliales bacterium]
MKIVCTLFSIFLALCVSAQEFSLTGPEYMQEQQYERAEQWFAAALHQSPDEPALRVGWADACLALGKKEEALAIYRQLQSSNPKAYAALVGMGKVALQKNNRVEMAEWFDRARRTDKMNPAIYVAIAEGCLQLAVKDSAAARNYLEQGLNMAPRDAGLHRLSALLSMSGKKYGEAINGLQRALFFDPNSALVYRELGALQTLTGAYPDAARSLEKSLALKGNQVIAWRYLGDLSYTTGDYAKAESAYQTFFERGGEKSGNLIERYAILLFLNKKYEVASQWLENLPEGKKEEWNTMRIKGYIALEKGETNHGIGFMERFFTLSDPRKRIVSDYTCYARLLSKKGADSLAQVQYEKALSLEPTRQDLLAETAAFASGINRHGWAGDLYRRLALTGKEQITHWFLAGKEYFMEGDQWRQRLASITDGDKTKRNPSDTAGMRSKAQAFYWKADSAFEQVNRLNDHYAGGYLLRGRVQSILDPDGKKAMARDAYQKALSILESDSAKNKKGILECYRYLGSWNWLQYEQLFRTNKAEASASRNKVIEIYSRIRELEPTDPQANQVLKSLSGGKP